MLLLLTAINMTSFHLAQICPMYGQSGDAKAPKEPKAGGLKVKLGAKAAAGEPATAAVAATVRSATVDANSCES